MKKLCKESDAELQRVAVQMKITEIISQLSLSKPGAEKDALEAQYQQLVSKLKNSL